jgi:hypothetical protein
VTAVKVWAIVRIVLGIAQIFGATFSFTLLIQTGVNPLSLGAVIVTGLLTTISVLLFGKRTPGGKRDETD